ADREHRAPPETQPEVGVPAELQIVLHADEVVVGPDGVLVREAEPDGVADRKKDEAKDESGRRQEETQADRGGGDAVHGEVVIEASSATGGGRGGWKRPAPRGAARAPR